jgi:5-formyltetrahydrofolate cyclo-ligase
VTIREDKRALRARLLAGRSALGAGDPRHAQAIRDRYLSAFDPAPGTVVSGFWPMTGEIDLRPVLEAVHARGGVCALPVVVAPRQPLVFRRWAPGVALETSRFGIQEPPADAPVVEPNHALVPLLAFDSWGYRLGYGGGFYDRTLARLRALGGHAVVAIGVGLAAQELDSVPHESFDERLDWLITDAWLREAQSSPTHP